MAKHAYSVLAESFIEGLRAKGSGFRVGSQTTRRAALPSTLIHQHSTLSNSAAILFADRVQAALGLFHAAPAAGPFVAFARGHRARAWPAADARVALVVQWIVRNVFARDPLPNVLL